MDQELAGGAPAPVTDANATQPKDPADAAPKVVSDADSSPAEKPKPAKTGEQIRIDELTRRLRETERRYERVLRIAEERGQPPPPPPQHMQAPAQPKGLKDFNYDDVAYREYVFKEAATKAAELARQQAQEALKEQSAATRRSAYEARAASFADTVEDFEGVLQGEWACSQPMAEVIEESAEGPALAYYLAQNPDVSAKLAKLSAAQAGRELARIEDRLVSERKKAAEKPVSQAPPPAPVIEAANSGHRVKSTDPEALSLPGDEWRKLREKELAAARKRKA
jgi:hypothetical protein